MFTPFTLHTAVQRFEGPNGWYHVPLPEDRSAALRPFVTETWPALLKVTATIDDYSWTATVMPIQDGPLFIALTAPVRKKLKIEEGRTIEVRIAPV